MVRRPTGGVGDMTETDRRALGERLKVWFDESGDPKRPTAVVEEDGIGQSPPAFPRTLLSLNEMNKVGQTWNMGTYGQGGAVTYGFCNRDDRHFAPAPGLLGRGRRPRGLDDRP